MFKMGSVMEIEIYAIIRVISDLQVIADTWIPKEDRMTQPSNQRVVSRFSLDY